MNSCQKYFSACALALLSQAAFAQAPDLGDASGFTVLGGTAVTCTDSVVLGNVGSTAAFTNTRCTILGEMPPATNADAIGARADFLDAYDDVRSMPCTTVLPSTITGPLTLTPGIYCTDAALTGAGVLTLDAEGDPDAVWIFQIGTAATGALTGTGFSVTMANGGKACNVFWAPSAAVDMTDSALKGNILAGDVTGGSITMTRGTLAGRALANIAVTMTDASLIGCDALSGSLSCTITPPKPPRQRCDQGVGNGPEGCDPGNSNQGDPLRSNDELGGTPGDPGRKGGNNK
jgi:hypothetical protein